MSPRRRDTNLSALFTWRSAISTPESGLTPTEHHVALTLSLHMNELGGSCYPSIFPTQHEETCGRSAATIREALNQLVWLGWIDRTVRVGREQSNEYGARIPEWYENHRSQADKDADVALRRAAAIAAATSAYGPRQTAPASRAASTKNRLTQAGSSGEASKAESAGADRENRRTPSLKPPGSGPESVKRAAGGRQTAADLDSSNLSLDAEERESPAAATPARDAEVRAIVEALPGADAGSAKQIIPLAHNLPRSTFFAVVKILEQRMRGGTVRNPCGLLSDLLKIARAEQAAVLSATLAATLGQAARSYVPAPWAIDTLKRDNPERYTRIVAKTLPNEQMLAEALDAHSSERITGCVEIYRAVRRGVVEPDRLGTPAQERARYVDEHFGDPDVVYVIDAWDDVDPVERQTLHDRVEQLRVGAESAADAA